MIKFSWIQILIFGIVIFGICIAGYIIFNQQKKSPNFMQEIQTNTNTHNLINEQWDFMPGVTKSNNGLLINPTDFSIVEQNGVFTQKNPPINLAGTHLSKINRDFEITFTINPLKSTSASLQFYGQVPIIADEFRVERESIRLTFEKNYLKVSIYNSTKETPIEEHTFNFSPKETNKIAFLHKDSKIEFKVNDIQIGSVNNAGIFKSGKMWFGLDAEGSEWLLTIMNIQMLDGRDFEIIDASTIQITENNQKGLQSLVSEKRPDFLVGTALALAPIVSDKEYAKIALDKNMFGSITAENQMKMINLQPQEGVYTFDHADALVKIAKQNGLKVHGHTLVFREANPPWFNNLPVNTTEDKQKIKAIMQDHITTVVKHFGNEINSWDVINEPLAENSNKDQSLRKHKWQQALGEDYIIQALEYAHLANPEALLFINEYGLEEDGKRWNDFISLLDRTKTKLLLKNIPLDKIAIGFQAHVYESNDRINSEILTKHIRQLEKMGFKMQISEMDVYSGDGEKMQAKQYADVFKTCINENNCIAWRGWILSDRYNLWKNNKGQILNGKDGLFDKNLKPTKAINSMKLSIE